MGKKDRQAQYFEELNKLFTGLPDKKRRLVDEALEKMAYLKAEMGELEDELKEYGRIEEGAHGTKVSARAILYQGYLKTYVSCVKTLLKEVPEEVEQSKLEAFLNEG